ncbi:MAG: PSD1 and planctomycete cytochrome C domain-containing protein [Planctomycetota bacterium]
MIRHALIPALIFTGCFSMVTAAQDRVSFAEQIRPLLNRHCVACHGGVKQAAGVSFVYADGLQQLIAPGDAAASYLIERVTDPNPTSRMPPADHGPALTDAEVQLFSTWINQGAHWEAHWAYQPPTRHTLPEVADPQWCHQPLDAFVLSRLERSGIAPAAEMPPARWLRRVTLDLTGLPPTPAQRKDFLEAFDREGEPAYAAAVDQLLASPHFGERWAAVWFDQVRYADSQGLGVDGDRKIWKYRDWVIQAFNHDLPYDQFTMKQIAGDLLPDATLTDHVATAVHRLTQTNEEGGTDDEEFRLAAVLDRVQTVGQTWQGISIGCVQCHSHPYDPIRHEEFYQLVALFNNTMDSDTGDDWPWVPVPRRESELAAGERLWQRARQLQAELWNQESTIAHAEAIWKPAVQLNVTGNAQLSIEQHAGEAQFVLTDNPRERLRIELDLPVPAGPVSGIRLNVLPLNLEAALADSEWGFVLRHFKAERLADQASPDAAVPIEIAHVVGDEPFPRWPPKRSLQADNAEGYAAFTRIHQRRQVAFVFADPVVFNEGDHLRVTLETHRNHAAHHPLIIKRGSLELCDSPPLRLQLDAQPLSELRNQLADTRAQLRAIASIPTPVLQERPPHLARPTHQFIGGLFLTKGDRVEAGVPASLALDDVQVDDRLSLAKWLVHPQNPLTARVTVNRFWARLFGIGLVATEEDFGSAGERPSHPRLLDDLAIRFQQDYQWSVKRLLRELVLSSTYRQDPRHRSDVDDPANRLLARGPHLPLSAEMVRDQALALSGLLSDALLGPPCYPPLPQGVWEPFRSTDTWETPKKGDAGRYRRSVYTYVKRSIPYPLHATFDAPTREFCTPRRLRSNTPLQPLTTLNDETFVECAAALADQLAGYAEPVPDTIRRGFLLTTCREPSDTEVDRLVRLHDQFRSETHPWLSVATVLLNLDEVLTK